MKIYTVESGSVLQGATVTTFELTKANVKFPAITVGEHSRGSYLGVLPINLIASNYETWKEKGSANVMFANITETKSGKPKLQETEKDDNPEKIILVLQTKIGFRGGNDHSGDRSEVKTDGTIVFKEFPGNILCSGMISQGAAGRMGSGMQYVAVIPIKTVFRTAYFGRLYGNPSSHYYYHDGNKLLSVTWDERCLSDIF